MAETEREKIVDLLRRAPFYAIMMDGSTDISGDEQEVLYIRTSYHGKVTEKVLCLGTPHSTISKDLKEFVVEKLDHSNINKEKLVCLGSDAACNMVGCRAGLAQLLREHLNKEMINVHCFAHRLELSFKDVFKTNKLYDKLMTLQIGLYYFYMKSYKSKKGLQASISALDIRGLLPQKVTGTRWMPHLARGITGLFRTFRAYEAHLSTCSHSTCNPKAEGLAKILLSKDVIAFAILLQEVLGPLMQLSLKLQKPEVSVAETFICIESTMELLEECKSSTPEELSELLESWKFQGVDLKGRTPTMYYKDTIINGLKEALEARSDTTKGQMDVINSSRILHLKNWPIASSPDLSEFGVKELRTAATHFECTLKRENPAFKLEDALAEFKLMKKSFYKRHGDQLQISYEEVPIS